MLLTESGLLSSEAEAVQSCNAVWGHQSQAIHASRDAYRHRPRMTRADLS